MIRILVGFFLMAGGVGGIEQNTDMFPSVCFAVAGLLLMRLCRLRKTFERLKKCLTFSVKYDTVIV